jgi:N-acetylglucosamine malate deacetylase 1
MKSRIKGLVKAGYRRLIPAGARHSLRLLTALEAPDHAPYLISDFDNQPVVVLAPHMDDETIGCGGTIRRHVLAGAKVAVVFMTDGRRGDPSLYNRGLSREQIEEGESRLIELRKKEAKAACDLLGVTETIYLDGPDGNLHETDELIEALYKVLSTHGTKYVYLPAMTDLHRDHWATNRIFNRAAAKLAKPPVVRGYEVWTPLLANAMVDITPFIEDKRRAIDAYVSQTQFVDYTRVTLALNCYRSNVHLEGKGYAEAFFEASATDYARLCQAIVTKPPVQ